MKKPPNKQLVKEILSSKQNGDWTPSWELIKVKVGEHFLGTSGDRCARKMAEFGEIERRHEGKTAYYRMKQPETAWDDMFSQTRESFNKLTGDKY